MNSDKRSISLRASQTLFVAVTLATLVTSVARASDAYIPKSDEEVLETLPRALISKRNEFEILRSRLRTDPKNAEIAAELASRYMELGSVEGDPRYYGYARAAIEPWWEAERPGVAILSLRAKLKEKDHQYDAAESDLHLLLEENPRDAQAWINLANIYRVQGEYLKAKEVGQTLSEFAGNIPTILCTAPIRSLRGEAEEAYAELVEAMPQAIEEFPSTTTWILTMQAEIAVALGRDEQAEEHFLEGLKDAPANFYLLRSYADFLLDRQRESEVLELLSMHESDNGILLRLAIAANRLGQEPASSRWQRQLQTRFDEIRLRGSEPHGRFESRFALEILDDPQQALELAQANWQKQKEFRDTRILLEAAVAANALEAAQPAVDFLKRHGTQHVVFTRLIEELESL